MRCDVEVPNESDGFVFTCAALRGRGISPGDAGWTAAIAACELLPLSVESEDPANVRVVVAEPLDAAELGEWVGVVRSALRVPDGRLALCGGIAYVLEKAAWAGEHACVVEVPAGEYRATLYCYASAPNGRLCIERAGSDEAPGTWFRRTRAGQAMPVWLHNRCVDDSSLDPGFRAIWTRAREKSGGEVVDFLLHLEPAHGPLVAAPVAAGGFMEAGECRQPDSFPLGIPAVGLGKSESQDEVAVAVEPQPAPDTGKAAAPGEPISIAGGPVDVPVAKLARVARIAWICHPYTHPGLRIGFPARPPRLNLDDVEDAELVIAGNEARIAFVNNGQPADALLPLTAVAGLLASAPDGTVIELSCARLKTKSLLGAHRYRGAVKAGIWQIEATLPAVDSATLTEALALVEALESGRRLMARDESEAQRLEARVGKVLADYFGSNALQRSGAELALRRRDPVLFAHVVARVFWSRYAQTWPLQDEDAQT